MAKSVQVPADPKLVTAVRKGKLTAEDVVRLSREGRKAEAAALMAALKRVAAEQPREIILTKGKEPVAKRRGRVVVQQKDGSWKPKDPPRSRDI